MATQVWAVPTLAGGMVLTGAMNTIVSKSLMSTTGVSETGQSEPFAKPWFLTLVMFLAMSVALPYTRAYTKCFARRSTAKMAEPLLAEAEAGGIVAPQWTKWKVLKTAIPALFDLIACGLANTGFLFVPASVWQMLRGSELLFAALLRGLCLGKHLAPHQWRGLSLTLLGVTMVGLAHAWATGSQIHACLGMGMVILSQAFQAGQAVAEEMLVEEDLPELEVLGIEGAWGAVMMVLFIFPLLFIIPGADHGHLEDEWDAWTLLISNSWLGGLLLAYFVSVSLYNMLGIAFLAASGSTVLRLMFDTLRTLVVWVFGLVIHYCVDARSGVGEAWTPYSYFEAAGFVLLILGNITFKVKQEPLCGASEVASTDSLLGGQGETAPAGLVAEEAPPMEAAGHPSA